MALSLAFDFYQRVEERFGKDLATDIAKLLDESAQALEREAHSLAVQKKLEVRDELSKELASKRDVELAEARLNGEIKLLEAKIGTRFEKQQRIFLMMFLSLLFATLFTNKETLVFFLKIIGVVK